MKKIKVDFAESIGEIKPLHGVNNAPYSVHNGEFVTKMFKEGGIPFSRLHDTMGAYGGAHYVDIPNVFPDFNADAKNPDNYDFELTDEYIKVICDAGTEVFYRLGITIDWAKKKYHTMPPADFMHWAEICEGIIRHYNEGWANGYHYNIKYWEIWNEPENPPMWSGTKEDYFGLYKVSSKYLKEKFPEIKIGGYGSCGFYAVTRDGLNDFYKSFIPYFEDFLSFVKKEALPLDFFSWHIYTQSPEEVLAHSEYVRKKLDENGFNSTETTLNEWNFGDEGTSHKEKRTIRGASFVAAVMCGLQQKGTVDSAMYYVASLSSPYNGLTDNIDMTYYKPFYSLTAFNELYLQKNGIKTTTDFENGVYSSASYADGKGTVLIANCNDSDYLTELELVNMPKKREVKAEFYVLDADNDMTLYKTEIFRGDTAIPVITVQGESVTKIRLFFS